MWTKPPARLKKTVPLPRHGDGGLAILNMAKQQPQQQQQHKPKKTRRLGRREERCDKNTYPEKQKPQNIHQGWNTTNFKIW